LTGSASCHFCLESTIDAPPPYFPDESRFLDEMCSTEMNGSLRVVDKMADLSEKNIGRN